MNNDSYKISIIVPVYGVEKYLDRCVESIISQSYTNLEIILVDDGSPDTCPQLCDAWALKDNRIKVIHQPNGGLSAARNSGMKVATGEFIYFVDSDDSIAKNLCEKAIEVFKQYQVDIVIFDCEKITENGKLLGGTEIIQNQVLPSKKAIEELVIGNLCDYAWNKVYRAYVFNGIWFPEKRCFEDAAVMYKVFFNANQIYTLNEKLYFYLQRSGSIISSMNIRLLEDLYQARKERYCELKAIYPEIANKALHKAVLGAVSLYDRSLWESGDAIILADAQRFLEVNKDKILAENKSFALRLYFSLPGAYNFMRRAKHVIGSIVKYIKKKYNEKDN